VLHADWCARSVHTSKPTKESKEHPSNMQITKIQKLGGRREESVFLVDM